MKGSSVIETEAPLTASSDCLKASGSASCMSTRDRGGPPAIWTRKYRRLEASPASGARVRHSAKNGSFVRTVSATSARSGGAIPCLGGGGSAVDIQSEL